MIWTSDLQISSLALYHLNYPGSIDGTALNLLLENNAIQALWSCDTICHNLTKELTFVLLIYCDIFKSNWQVNTNL